LDLEAQVLKFPEELKQAVLDAEEKLRDQTDASRFTVPSSASQEDKVSAKIKKQFPLTCF
jgi:hypothetical protein